MKSVTNDVAAVLSASNFPAVALVRLDFSGGTVRVCNAGYNFVWGGHTWVGLGQLGSISAIQEGQETQMYGCTLTLTGIDPSLVSLSLDPAEYQGKDATIWLAPLDDSHQVISTPVIVFKGRMDTMQIELGETATISVNVESRLVDWERPRVRHYNHADQTSEYPGDMGFEFVEQMVEKEIVWGRP